MREISLEETLELIEQDQPLLHEGYQLLAQVDEYIVKLAEAGKKYDHLRYCLNHGTMDGKSAVNMMVREYLRSKKRILRK